MKHYTYRWSRGSKEDEGAEVCGALVGESAGSVNQSTNTVCLDGGAGEGSSPSDGGGSSLLGLDKFLSGVGLLCAAVGVAKDWAKDGKRCGVVEDSAERDGRWLDWWEVCRIKSVLIRSLLVDVVARHGPNKQSRPGGGGGKRRLKELLTVQSGHCDCDDEGFL